MPNRTLYFGLLWSGLLYWFHLTCMLQQHFLLLYSYALLKYFLLFVMFCCLTINALIYLQFARNFAGSIWFLFIIFNINATSVCCCCCCYNLLVQLSLFAVCSLPSLLFVWLCIFLQLVVAALFADKLLARSARVRTICATLKKVAQPTPTASNKVYSVLFQHLSMYLYALVDCLQLENLLRY